MINYPKALSREERKKRLKESDGFVRAQNALNEDTIEGLEALYENDDLNEHQKAKALRRATEIRKIRLKKDILSSGNVQSIDSILSSVLVVGDDKARLIDSVRKEVLHQVYGHSYKSSYLFGKSEDFIIPPKNSEDGFDKIMESIIFTEEERNKVLFNMDKTGDHEFGKSFDDIITVKDITKIIKDSKDVI
jgi:hypothetical protein